jgi:alpha-beta hydrolase superfamily lysophospholipase
VRAFVNAGDSMKTLYLHGLHSKPGGVKPTFLRAQGHEVLNPALPDEDFAESMRRAQKAFDEGRPGLVVGSSRGGAVAINLAAHQVPVILIAPAWKRWGSTTRATLQTIIIHSANDEVIPIGDSRELVAASGLPPDALIVAGADHNMTDAEAFAALREAVHTIAHSR